MKYTFSLDETDYLTHQLFISATSKPSLNGRRKSWLLVTGAFGLLAFVFYQKDDVGLSNYFIFTSILSLIFYPFYIRWKYKRHFKKYINEHFSKNFGKKAYIELQEGHILTQDEDRSESKISCTSIESFHELPEHFLIRLNNGQSLILPKNKIEQLDQLRSDLSQLANKRQLLMTDNLNWKWEKSW